MAFFNRSQYFLHSVFILLLICFTIVVKETRGDEHDYKDALTKSILFFEGQRSGELPPDQRMDWRGNSALSDGQEAGVNLSGGYYDAGDNVKFNFPMAFTTTMLSWSVIEFGGRMKIDDLRSARKAIRWGADYLLKCASKVESDNKLFAGVANPTLDHNCWERPEDMDTDRSVYSVTAGSDLAGETAAALAAASIVFRKVEHRYSQLLRDTADVVMQFAMKNLARYSDQLGGNVCPYYCSYSGFQDELLWGAAWMYKATNKSGDYRDYIKSFGYTSDVNAFSWDSKFAGAYVVLAREYLVGRDDDFQKFVGKAETFMCNILRDSPYRSIQFTPGGMMFNENLPDSPLQYVTSLSFLITTYANYKANRNAPTHSLNCGGHVFNTKYLRDQAKSQLDYILGTNPKNTSYMVGYGRRYPSRVHHRASSSPSIKDHPQHIACLDGFGLYLHVLTPNPNTLTGAIVGGPDGEDKFEDVRDQGQTEPTTYTNAAIVGPLAYFAAKQN